MIHMSPILLGPVGYLGLLFPHGNSKSIRGESETWGISQILVELEHCNFFPIPLAKASHMAKLKAKGQGCILYHLEVIDKDWIQRKVKLLEPVI